jgi:hypothetical protein
MLGFPLFSPTGFMLGWPFFMNALKVLSFLAKILSLVVVFDFTALSPEWGLLIFIVASTAKDAVNRIGDYLDNKKLDNSWVPILLAGGLVLFATGCKTPEVTAYRTLGTTAAAVDRAMLAWGDYVRAGLATADDEVKARRLYSSYQSAMAVAKQAVMSLKSTQSDPNSPAWIRALDAVDAASAELISFINSFRAKPSANLARDIPKLAYAS